MKTIRNRRGSLNRAGAVILFGTVILSGTVSAEADDPSFTMNAIEDAASGRTILAGRYATAIDRIDVTRGSAVSRFFAANNLCVAQVKAGEIGGAAESCELAVAAIRGTLGGLPPGRRSASLELAYRKYLAIALSNRGVLHAVAGKPSRARADFAEAADLETPIRSPEGNLARLARAADDDAWPR
jgi:hypothetical protein